MVQAAARLGGVRLWSVVGVVSMTNCNCGSSRYTQVGRFGLEVIQCFSLGPKVAKLRHLVACNSSVLLSLKLLSMF